MAYGKNVAGEEGDRDPERVADGELSPAPPPSTTAPAQSACRPPPPQSACRPAPAPIGLDSGGSVRSTPDDRSKRQLIGSFCGR